MIDFLIVGSFKSASSSLAYELRRHPSVDIPIKKDPYFYLADLCKILIGPHGFIEKQNSFSVYDRGEFASLFIDDGGATLKGDATPLYLYCHEYSIPAIQNDNPDAHIIIILRNPIDRAFSNYMHNVKDGYEQRSFAECIIGWKETELLPLHPFFHYVRAGFYYEQVAAFLNEFKNVKIINYEDLSKNPQKILVDVANFLKITPEFDGKKFQILNKTGTPLIKKLHNFLTYDSKIKDIFRPLFRFAVREKNDRIRIVEYIKNTNLRKKQLSDYERTILQNIYHKDVILLSELLDYDFNSSWNI